MSKYIKLEDAISKIVNTPTRVITGDLTALVDRQHEIIDMLSDLPTIEFNKEGEWEVEERDSYFGKKIVLTCSECGDVFSVTESAYPNERYCRYCGAKMKG